MMNHRLRSVIVVLSALIAMAGCSPSSMFEKKIDYKSAGKLPPLEVPPDLTTPSTDDRYTVPEVNAKGTATYSVYSRERTTQPAPGTTGLLPNQEQARIERAGTQRWLVVQGNPETVWPVIKDFWQEMGFLIQSEDPLTGVMETDWAENRAKIPQDPIRNVLGKIIDQLYSTAERDKFRTRLERGAAGTTEIYVSHRGMYEVLEGGDYGRADRTIWQPRPADPDLEAEMLRRLMVRFGVEEARAQALIASGNVEPKAKLTSGQGGTGNLALDDAFDRAWRRVGLALDRIGFTVEDRDRSQGLYFVRYVDPEADNKKKDTGLLSSLAFWRSDDAAKPNPEQYRIQVKSAGTGTLVSVLNKEGASEQSKTATKILNLLYEQLK